MKEKIFILPSHVIEQSKWDHCIETHHNGLFYARYDYLDNICDQWHGLVVDDYKAVLALPWRRKYGIRYFYTPPFIQQLGLIGDIAIDDLEKFTRKIRQFAWYGHLNLNFSNQLIAQAMKAAPKTNFIIDLKKGYNAIYEAYSVDLKQILRKENTTFQYSDNKPIPDIIDEYKSLYGQRMPHISTEDFARLNITCKHFAFEGSCITRSITTDDGRNLSNTLLLIDNKRIYHLLNTTTAEGRKLNSNHHLLDLVLKEFAGKDLIFDFEGSEIDGVKSFYKKFGGTIQPYFQYHRNAFRGI